MLTRLVSGNLSRSSTIHCDLNMISLILKVYEFESGTTYYFYGGTYIFKLT